MLAAARIRLRECREVSVSGRGLLELLFDQREAFIESRSCGLGCLAGLPQHIPGADLTLNPRLSLGRTHDVVRIRRTCLLRSLKRSRRLVRGHVSHRYDPSVKWANTIEQVAAAFHRLQSAAL